MVQSRKDTNFIHIYSYIQDTINNTETERRLFFFLFSPISSPLWRLCLEVISVITFSVIVVRKF